MASSSRVGCLAYVLAALVWTHAGRSQCKPNLSGSREVQSRLTAVLREYDFVIHLRPDLKQRAGEEIEGYCEAPGEVIIYRKGSTKPLQTIGMREIFISLKDGGEPLTNSAQLYDDQGVVNVGDFNFDGHEDFAVQNGNHGSYGAPSYNVYLFSTTKGQFELNRPLTDLVEQTLGFFQVDPVHKRLVTRSKSGAVYHEMTTYAVIHDYPVLIMQVIEDGRRDAGNVYVTKKRLVKGKWQSTTHRYSQATFYEKETSSSDGVSR
jgi:hypothetical protein